jgi:hypothetical protein
MLEESAGFSRGSVRRGPMERRALLRQLGLAAGAALLAQPREARAAVNNSNVTLGGVVAGRQTFNVSDPEGIAAVLVFRRLTGGISLQSRNCGNPASCVTSVPVSDYQLFTHWIVVLDAGAHPSADLWRVDPNSAPVLEG